MVDIQDQGEEKEIKEPAEPEISEPALPESAETQQAPELGNEEETLRQLKEKVEQAHLPQAQQQQAQDDAQQLAQLNDDNKVKNLLKIAQVKGVIYAVNVAKKMDNPYVLDQLHDQLTSQGRYKQFLQK